MEHGYPRHNLDEFAFRALKARAALTGRTIGQTVNEAIQDYLSCPGQGPKAGTLADLQSLPFPADAERLSEMVDSVVYGVKRSL